MKFEFIFANTYCKEEAKTEEAINFPWKNKGEKERKSVPQKLYSKAKATNQTPLLCSIDF